MCELDHLIKNNSQWAEQATKQDPEFFSRLADQQSPEYLWIGCSDSRVPANQIVGLAPGEIFVHRNIANAVQATDINCLSVIQYAVEALKVKHIIVCGHYSCGGVMASMTNNEHGLVDHWIRQIKDVYAKHKEEIDQLPDQQQQVNRMCELNVKEQVSNLAKTKVVQNAWSRGQELTIHGWIYSLKDGLINDLQVTQNSIDQVDELYRLAPGQ